MVGGLLVDHLLAHVAKREVLPQDLLVEDAERLDRFPSSRLGQRVGSPRDVIDRQNDLHVMLFRVGAECQGGRQPALMVGEGYIDRIRRPDGFGEHWRVDGLKNRR